MQSGWLEISSLAVIVTNTAVMASHSYPENPQWLIVSDCLNVAFCFYFSMELLVKLHGVGLRAFARDKMNLFDALVVAASLVEVVMYLLPGDETSRICIGMVPVLSNSIARYKELICLLWAENTMPLVV